MKTKLLYLSILLTAISKLTLSQTIIDTSTLKIIAKIEIVKEVICWNDRVIDKIKLNQFLDSDIGINFLVSRNFPDFIFIKIPIDSSGEVVGGFTLLGNCNGYFLSIDKRNLTVYRLQGFWDNDLVNFFKRLKTYSYKNINSSRSFHKYYHVDNLDLKCLFKYYRNNFKKKQINCFSPCGEPLYVY